ncbi:hypothetical protein ACFSKI_21840 [Pseudogracilibacillus auburnensis]|uniref:Uncharacterized protein n=1 Tax=Pseudogracilibacillus auburnensis TaxID=1494959 RepID=A0A2V3VX34_9BACI|nr:hypothetical protein [Pseudogracilibacillus auburnensis]MBO1004558.1 hypothetical protein [Pseudogracilibacillus auburnensis]PXW85238.1 hypothetical protein DFR56_1114 [Pseudogracilibacillus auburnensis]
MKKESIFKKIFSSKKDCCSIDIEEVDEKKVNTIKEEASHQENTSSDK